MEQSCKRPQIFLGLMAWIFVLLGAAFADEGLGQEKKRDILKLLEVSGLMAQMGYMKDGAIEPYGRMISLTYPKVPDAFWDEFNKLIGKEEMELLMNRVVRVYDKHMSHDIIKQLIKMFSTPFWEEWKQKMPAISREAGLIGSQWTQEILQSEAFKKKVDYLVKKYDLEKLNPIKKDTPQAKENPK